jgi:hypothetical protein
MVLNAYLEQSREVIHDSVLSKREKIEIRRVGGPLTSAIHRILAGSTTWNNFTILYPRPSTSKAQLAPFSCG